MQLVLDRKKLIYVNIIFLRGLALSFRNSKEKLKLNSIRQRRGTMANIQEHRDKSGKLISYSIRVHRGRGADGKQLKPWTMTFEVSPI